MGILDNLEAYLELKDSDLELAIQEQLTKTTSI